MDAESLNEREVRAGRNQSLFRAVNEKIREMEEAFSSVTETFVIACECADRTCIRTLEIARDEYVAVRKEPRHFAVLTGHVYPEVEKVVRETESYVIVEKNDVAGEIAEQLAPGVET